MNAEARGDLKYSGVLTIPGGKYDSVDLSGVVKVDGDLDCLRINTGGVFREAGNLVVETGWLNGSAQISGDLKSGTMDASGDTRVEGSLSVEKLHTEGRLVVKGNVRADDIDARGHVRIGGDCNAETLDIRGAITIDKTLNAGSVDLQVYWGSAAKEICGERIRVRKGRDNHIMDTFATLFNPLNFLKAHLKVETVEGDDIDLEHTTAKVVRGNKVTIGDGCDVELVEYKDEFNKAPKANVGKYVKV
jgi:cytoskeletal protein CcmA (bactofilin family)